MTNGCTRGSDPSRSARRLGSVVDGLSVLFYGNKCSGVHGGREDGSSSDACGRDDGRSRRPRADWDAGSAHALAVGAQGYDLLQQTERTLRLIDHIATNTCEKAMWE